MPDIQLNGGNILITLAVILIVLEGLNVISKGVDAFKKLTGKDARAKEMQAVKERIGKLEAWQVTVDNRLKTGNEKFKRGEEDSMMSLKALHRIIKHLQSGNDHEKLKETDEEMYEYLMKRGVKKEDLQ